jgi:hypothetical protein|tara:strand:- start:344 stop:550 length:207 start_codon:yes stop_codon:yes gene_type:complete
MDKDYFRSEYEDWFLEMSEQEVLTVMIWVESMVRNELWDDTVDYFINVWRKAKKQEADRTTENVEVLH